MPEPGRDVLLSMLIDELTRGHVGAANGITAAALASRLHISERMLRTLVSRAREDGVAIAGHPSNGYFIARSGAELEACCAFLRSRAMHSLVIEARLRRIALPELLGQIRLGT